ncbi:hypothetical protein [Actinoplanes sp. NPDC089786]|uniref:hypothetical protein n=1 Tax=Actinoplanes sp. NPDC089786 TaxID=3155185 RepID=UPI00342B19A6
MTAAAEASAPAPQMDPPTHPCNAAHDGDIIQDEFGRWECRWSNGAWRWISLDLPGCPLTTDGIKVRVAACP